MGALTSVFEEIKNAVLAMRGNAYDEDDKEYLNEVIDDAIKENPEDLEGAKNLRNFKEIAVLTYKDLEQNAEKMFDKSPRLEDKIEKEKAKVDVEAAKKSSKAIEKEDRQRIR